MCISRTSIRRTPTSTSGSWPSAGRTAVGTVGSGARPAWRRISGTCAWPAPSDPAAPAKGVDLWFVAHGDFARLDDEKFLERLSNAGRGEGKGRELTKDELAKANAELERIRRRLAQPPGRPNEP